MKFVGWFPLLLVVTIGVFGCGDSNTAQCTADDHCPECQYCVDGICQVSEEICGDDVDNDCDGDTDEGCIDTCDGITCNSPPSPSCIDTNTLRRHQPTGSCSDGVCDYDYQDVTCDLGCKNGACLGDPCAGVICDTPSDDFCIDTSTLRRHQPTGSCSDGVCDYDYQDVTCDFGCENGACLGDPCAGVICDTPSDDFCIDTSTLRRHQPTGSCSDGVCDYDYQDVTCDFGCENGACKEDPCIGVECNNPPHDVCMGGDLLWVFDELGECINGECEYSHREILCVEFCSNGACQGFSTTWARTYGGDDNDICLDIQPTSDGGYFVIGTTESFHRKNAEIWLLRLDASGNVIWQRRIHDDFTSYDCGYSIQLTTDGGVILTGEGSRDSNRPSDLWIIKLNVEGELEWQRLFGGSSWNAGQGGVSIRQTSDGGYVVAGYAAGFGGNGYEDLWVLRLDGSGDIIWEKVYGRRYDDQARSIQETSDHGFVVAGWSVEWSYHQFWVLRLDVDGNVVWQYIYSEPSVSRKAWAESIQETPDQGFIVGGIISGDDVDGLGDFWIVKLDSGGIAEWQAFYRGRYTDYLYSIQVVDGGYIAAGCTNSFGAGEKDVWVIRLDTDGGIVWQKTYGGEYHDCAYAVRQTTDGHFVVAGYTKSFGVNVGVRKDLWILKLDDQGNIASSCNSGLGQNSDANMIPSFENQSACSATTADSSAIVTHSNGVLVDTSAEFSTQCGS